jgi:hypothetical protein
MMDGTELVRMWKEAILDEYLAAGSGEPLASGVSNEITIGYFPNIL